MASSLGFSLFFLLLLFVSSKLLVPPRLLAIMAIKGLFVAFLVGKWLMQTRELLRKQWVRNINQTWMFLFRV